MEFGDENCRVELSLKYQVSLGGKFCMPSTIRPGVVGWKGVSVLSRAADCSKCFPGSRLSALV